MKRLILMAAVLALLAAACGDDAEPTTAGSVSTSSTTTTSQAQATTTSTTTTSTTTSTTTTTTVPAPPSSSVTSSLDVRYVFGSGSGEPTIEELGFDPAAVTVHWFRGDQTMVAVYEGLDPAASPYLCPGNSIFTGGRFDHTSNAPAPGADCSAGVAFGANFIDSVPGSSGIQVCNGVVSSITSIPNDLDGDLFGTVEVFPPDGRFLGASGFVTAAAADIPEIDQTTLSCGDQPPGPSAGSEESDAFDEIVAFYDRFNAAQAAGDAATLDALLHPATIERYGAEACTAYLEGIVNPEVTVTPVAQVGFGSWSYETDGVATTIDEAYSVEVLVTVGDAEPVEQVAHLARGTEGTLVWFTDCGEPVG